MRARVSDRPEKIRRVICRHPLGKALPESLATVRGDEIILVGEHALRLRELRADDRTRIESLLAHVVPSDLYSRFFSAFRELPPGLIDHLMRIDPTERVTVVAVAEPASGDSEGEVVAVARAHRMAGDCAEVALLVRSDLKGQGLGSLLLGRLITRCRMRGVSRLMGEVMWHNNRMLRLAARYGFRCEAVDDGSCYLILDLEDGSLPGRLITTYLGGLCPLPNGLRI